MADLIDPTPALTAFTTLLLSTLRSGDPRRFSVVHEVSKLVQRFIRATSLRVEDFEDSDRIESFLRKSKSIPPTKTLVPDLEPKAAEVLEALSNFLDEVLNSARGSRFADAERISAVALHFITLLVQAQAQATPPRQAGEVEIICENPEEIYIQQEAAAMYVADLRNGEAVPGGLRGNARPAGVDAGHPRDVNQLRREILEIEGTQSQIAAELARAKIAEAEASELDRLLSVQKNGDSSLLVPTLQRIAQLKANLEFRTKGMTTNGVVSTDVLRGHQSRRAGAGDDGVEGYTGHPRREEGPRGLAEARPVETLGLITMGDA